MTNRKAIRIPTYMRPQPWAHLLAWLFRVPVPTFDYVTAYSAQDTNDERIRWRDKYHAAQGRIDDLIREHVPTLRNPEYLTSGWDRRQLEFACASPRCHFSWPCPSFQWAVDRKYTPMRVNLSDFEVKDQSEDEAP